MTGIDCNLSRIQRFCGYCGDIFQFQIRTAHFIELISANVNVIFSYEKSCNVEFLNLFHIHFLRHYFEVC